MTCLYKVLIIEDRNEVVEAISLALTIRWPNLEIFSAKAGLLGVDLVETENPEAVILDLGLPDISGFEVIERIRLFSNVPILVLTILDDENDVVRALELGADEYVVKPFRPAELCSRLKALARRKISVEQAQIACGPHVLDFNSQTLHFRGHQIFLTNTETAILHFLLQNAGHAVTLSSLARNVWGEEYPEDLRKLKVYVRRIRTKIEPDPSTPIYLLTRVGVGYCWAKTIEARRH